MVSTRPLNGSTRSPILNYSCLVAQPICSEDIFRGIPGSVLGAIRPEALAPPEALGLLSSLSLPTLEFPPINSTNVP